MTSWVGYELNGPIGNGSLMDQPKSLYHDMCQMGKGVDLTLLAFHASRRCFYSKLPYTKVTVRDVMSKPHCRLPLSVAIRPAPPVNEPL